MAALAALPAILAPFSTAITVAGTLASVAGTLSAASAERDTANYNAKVQDRDAFVADQNRKSILNQTELDQQDKRRENARTFAAMHAAFGASGFDLAGSPLDVLTDTASEQALDVKRIGHEGQIRARDSALQILGYREGAGLSRAEAQNAKSGMGYAVAGQIAGGAGKILQRTA